MFITDRLPIATGIAAPSTAVCQLFEARMEGYAMWALFGSPRIEQQKFTLDLFIGVFSTPDIAKAYTTFFVDNSYIRRGYVVRHPYNWAKEGNREILHEDARINDVYVEYFYITPVELDKGFIIPPEVL